MFENLSDRLERSFKILKGQGKITEINVAETLKEVRRALLDADVNYKTAKEFTETVRQKALGQNVLNAVKPEQMMVKIVHDELATLMGGYSCRYQHQRFSGSHSHGWLTGIWKDHFFRETGLYAQKQTRQKSAAGCGGRLSSCRH